MGCLDHGWKPCVPFPYLTWLFIFQENPLYMKLNLIQSGYFKSSTLGSLRQEDICDLEANLENIALSHAKNK